MRQPRNEDAETKFRSMMVQGGESLIVECRDELDGYRFTVWPRRGGQVVGNTLPRDDFDRSVVGDIKPATAYFLARIEHAFADGPPPPPPPPGLPALRPRGTPPKGGGAVKRSGSAGSRRLTGKRRLTGRRRTRR